MPVHLCKGSKMGGVVAKHLENVVIESCVQMTEDSPLVVGYEDKSNPEYQELYYPVNVCPFCGYRYHPAFEKEIIDALYASRVSTETALFIIQLFSEKDCAWPVHRIPATIEALKFRSARGRAAVQLPIENAIAKLQSQKAESSGLKFIVHPSDINTEGLFEPFDDPVLSDNARWVVNWAQRSGGWEPFSQGAVDNLAERRISLTAFIQSGLIRHNDNGTYSFTPAFIIQCFVASPATRRFEGR